MDGNDKLFYSRLFIFYMPRITKDSFNRHKVGLAVFIMQDMIDGIKNQRIKWGGLQIRKEI